MELAAIQDLLHPEDDVLTAVRGRVGQAVDVPDVGVGALVAHVAARHAVRHAVVFGSAGGVTCAWLLNGMVERGIITCIEPDGRRHALLSDAAQELRLGDHLRLINANPEEAAARLRDGNYDLVLIQLDSVTTTQVEVAARLLRVGGMLVVRHAGSLGEDVVQVLAGTEWIEHVVIDTDDGVVTVLRDHDPDA